MDLETYMQSLKRYALKLIDKYLPISSTAWPKKRFAICYFFIVMPSLLWFNRWILTFSFFSVTTVVELERTQCKFHRRSPTYAVFTTLDPTTPFFGLCTYMQVRGFWVSTGPPTVPLTGILRNTFFFQVPKSAYVLI